MDGYNHYIRIDSNNIVIYGFSDAFEQPITGDIPLSGDNGRHFQIQLMTDTGQYKYKLVNGQMVDRTQDADYLLTVAKQSKLDYLRATEASNLQTFQSTALGTPHTYLAGITDMVLLSAEYAYLKGGDYKGETILWYTVEAGNLVHTQAQMIQVYLDGRTAVANTKYHRATLEAQVGSATTASQVDAIVW